MAGRAAAAITFIAVLAGAALVHWRRRRRKPSHLVPALLGPPPDEWRHVARTVMLDAAAAEEALDAEQAPPARVPPATRASPSETAISVLYEIHARMPCRVEACAVPPAPKGTDSALTDAGSSDGASLSDGSLSQLSSRMGSPVSSRLGFCARASSSAASSLAGDASPRALRRFSSSSNRGSLAAGGRTHTPARRGNLPPARSPHDARNDATPRAMPWPHGTPPPTRDPPSPPVSISRLVPCPPHASMRHRMKSNASAHRAAAAARLAAAAAAAAASEALSAPRLAEAAHALRLIMALQQAGAVAAQSTHASAPTMPKGATEALVASSLPPNASPPATASPFSKADRASASGCSATAVASADAATIAALAAFAPVPSSGIFRLHLHGRLLLSASPNPHPDLGCASAASTPGSACSARENRLSGLSAAESPLPGTVRALSCPVSGGAPAGQDGAAASIPDHAVLCWAEARAVVLVVGSAGGADGVGRGSTTDMWDSNEGKARREGGASGGAGGSSGGSECGGKSAGAATAGHGSSLRSEAALVAPNEPWRSLPPACLLPCTGFCSGRSPAALATAARALWAGVSPAVFRALRANPGSELLIIGHGVGGGVAGLLSILIRHESLVLPRRAPLVRCLMYGPPAVFGPIGSAAPPPGCPWPTTPPIAEAGAPFSSALPTSPPSASSTPPPPSTAYAPSHLAQVPHNATTPQAPEPTSSAELRALHAGLHLAVGEGVTAFILGDDCVPFCSMDAGRRMRAAAGAVEGAVRAATREGGGQGGGDTADGKEAEGGGVRGGQAEGCPVGDSVGSLGRPSAIRGQGHPTSNGCIPALPDPFPPSSPLRRHPGDSRRWLDAIRNSLGGRAAPPSPAELAALDWVRQAAAHAAASVEPTRRAPRLCIPASVVVWIRPTAAPPPDLELSEAAAATHLRRKSSGGAAAFSLDQGWTTRKALGSQRGDDSSFITATPAPLGEGGRSDVFSAFNTRTAQQQNAQQEDGELAAPPVFGPEHAAYACGPFPLSGLGVRLTPRMKFDHAIGSYAAALEGVARAAVARAAEGRESSEAAGRGEAPLGRLVSLPSSSGTCGAQVASPMPSGEEEQRGGQRPTLQADSVAGSAVGRDSRGKRCGGAALGGAADNGSAGAVSLHTVPPFVVPLGILPTGEKEGAGRVEDAVSTPRLRPSGYLGDRSCGEDGEGSSRRTAAGRETESRRRRLRYDEEEEA